MRISDWSSDVCSSDLIASGATLRTGEVATEFGPDSAILTTSVVTDGTLVLDFDSDEVLEEADDLVITGTGTVRLEGAATIVVDRADAAQHTGRTEVANGRSEEHTSELQSLMRISYDVFCLKIISRHQSRKNMQTR